MTIARLFRRPFLWSLLVAGSLVACQPSECDKLCEAWGGVTSGQLDCATELLEERGYPVMSTPACVGAETPEQCAGCASLLEVTEEDCAAVYEACVVGTGATEETQDPAGSEPAASGSVEVGVGGVKLEGSMGRGGENDTEAGVAISVGPDGIKLEGRGKKGDRQSEGGEAEGEGEDAPAETPKMATLEGCASVCARWPGVTSGQLECATVVLEAFGYPISETPACLGAETEAQCGVCRDILKISDKACNAVAERCLGGRRR